MESLFCICPNCQHQLECDETLTGQLVSCPICGEEILLNKQDLHSEEKPAKRIVAITQKTPPRQISKYISDNDESSDGIWQSSLDPTSEKFKLPLCSIIIYISIGIQIAAAVLVVFFVILDERNVNMALLIPLLIPIPFQIGAAQLCNFVAKSCYNSNHIVKLLQKINAKIKK